MRSGNQLRWAVCNRKNDGDGDGYNRFAGETRLRHLLAGDRGHLQEDMLGKTHDWKELNYCVYMYSCLEKKLLHCYY